MSLGPRASKLARRALVLIILGACVLAAGIELLDRGKYEYDTEHPPLGRVFLAIGPYLAGARSFGTPPPEGTPEGLHILYSKGAYWRDLTLARLGMLPFLALLLYATWLWARRLLPSEGAALLAVVLVASVPPVLGHAALASLDVAAAATTLLALYALQCWMVSAQLRDAVFFGLASGVAVVTKFSSVPFIGVSLIVLTLTHWLALRRHGSAATVPAAALPAAGLPVAPLADPAPTWARRAAGLALAALAAVSAVLVFRGAREWAAVALAFGGLTLSQLALSGYESLAPSLSAYHIVDKIRDRLKPDTPFYFVDTFDHTALFYLRRQVTMVGVKDELVDPIERAPRDFLPDAAAFARAWEADPEAFAMLNTADLEPFLKAHPVPMRVIARDPRRVIVSKP